jgi:hypothetical protein
LGQKFVMFPMILALLARLASKSASECNSVLTVSPLLSSRIGAGLLKVESMFERTRSDNGYQYYGALGPPRRTSTVYERTDALMTL